MKSERIEQLLLLDAGPQHSCDVENGVEPTLGEVYSCTVDNWLEVEWAEPQF